MSDLLDISTMSYCGNCRFFKPYDDKRDGCETDGDCRRHPCQVYGDSEVCRVSWPGVMREEWCGEWEQADG